MTHWAIGDIQGCSDAFFRLLEKIAFSPSRDHLWVAGDLVNRGDDNVSVLRYLQKLEQSASIVLGNHDLHLLAASVGARKLSRKDTLQDVLTAPDSAALLHWLRHQKLLHTATITTHTARPTAHQTGSIESTPLYCMTHAGIPVIWRVEQAKEYAKEVETCLQHPDTAKDFFYAMYGNTPAAWKDNLVGTDRLRTITNYFTRMRFIHSDGSLDFDAKEGIEEAPPHYHPWFNYSRHPDDNGYHFLFGHWAALEGQTHKEHIHALDTGCVWGGTLTVMNLHTQERISVLAEQ